MSGSLLRQYRDMMEQDLDQADLDLDDESMSDSEKLDILVSGLLNLRPDLESGSLEMQTIDGLFSEIGMSPWKERLDSEAERAQPKFPDDEDQEEYKH